MPSDLVMTRKPTYWCGNCAAWHEDDFHANRASRTDGPVVGTYGSSKTFTVSTNRSLVYRLRRRLADLIAP